MRVLEVMRQPMEDKVVTISRAKGSLTFSVNFQLVAAMNPCPCGYYGDSVKPCSCASSIVTKYQKRISGPLLDRIDIHIEVPRVDCEKLSGDRLGESSETIRARVQSARAYHRILKLARTIADLAGSEDIQSVHLAEALQYRPKVMIGQCQSCRLYHIRLTN